MDLIALDKQVHLYSVDTKAFYTDAEMSLNRKIDAMRYERKKIKKVVDIWDAFISKKITEKKMARLLKDAKYDGDPLTAEIVDDLKQHSKELIDPINQTKKALLNELEQYQGSRIFRPEFLRQRNIISIFESELTRMIGIETSTLTDELIVVKTCYFKVLKDIVLNGFELNGEHYDCLTASAGQIRTKRSVFIKRDTLDRITPRLYCGLTVEHINELGGINTNKYLAYLALCNSATDVWYGFDIRKSIVVDDMETDVVSLVDYIDDKTYQIERKTMPVPITHTDGAGMVRPDVCRKNFMIRLPFVKGLLNSFPFDKFIREANRKDPSKNYGIVKDIYGVEHDVLAEDIQVILTKSQFKMYKFYPNWDTYCNNFERYGCQACVCNLEPTKFENAKINYQMLQTLTDLTDNELLNISKETRSRLAGLSSDRSTMLKVFGATKENEHRNGFQESLLLYPELLQDEYSKETLREIKKSLEKEAKAGKLDIDGCYTFIVPDMYAFCQWLFYGDKNPSGLLGNGEVHCPLFSGGVELDCLRSPHLYVEHAVRTNMVGADHELGRWFKTNAIVTSVHDPISKILQFDCDGDKSLVVQDPDIVQAAKRNTAGIVPLYYQMAKAGAQPITKENIYNSMILAYVGGNIGQISNDISIIWNTESGENRLEAVKLLCMENNFTIDYAKTLYKPVRPDQIHSMIHRYTKKKVPHFFVYAKDKTETQVEPINSSPVNRLEYIIPKIKMDFKTQSLGKFDPKMLMRESIVPTNDITKKIIETYGAMSKSDAMKAGRDERGVPRSLYGYQKIIDSLLEICNDIYFVTDVLIKELFIRRKSKRKNIFWMCFGDIVAENVKRNIGRKTGMCVKCGARFYRESNRQVMCKSCAAQSRKISNRMAQRRKTAKKSAFKKIPETVVAQ